MKLYVDLETLQLIEGPGFRNPVSALRFKRGDAARLDVSFLSAGLTPSSIGDPAALEMTFGVKLRNAYASDYLVHATDWTIPAAGAAQVYRCSPSFNTEALNEALGVGSGTEVAEVSLMGEITWREGAGLPTSTRTFSVMVENDVNRGTEGTPLSAPTPENWLDGQRPPVILRTAAEGIPVSNVFASLVMEAGNSTHEILYTAKVLGAAGNAIQIAYTAATNKGTTDVTVAGNLITVALGDRPNVFWDGYGLSDEHDTQIPQPENLQYMGIINGKPSWNTPADDAQVFHDGVSKWKITVDPEGGGHYEFEATSMADLPDMLNFQAVAPMVGETFLEIVGSTVADVVAAVNNHAEAGTLVNALALFGTTNNEVANGIAATALAGGISAAPEASVVGQLLRYGDAAPFDWFIAETVSPTLWRKLNIDPEAGSGGTSPSPGPSITINETTTGRTLDENDAFAYIRCSNPAGCAISIPAQATVAWAADVEIYVRRLSGCGPLSVIGVGGVAQINNGDAVVGVLENGTFALRRVGDDEWDFI
jgi:hypothetical protein